MYFVVYSICDKEYFVIPKGWIQDLNFEEIVNDIINSILTYKCYCGNDENAYINVDGKRRPNLEYTPDFGIKHSCFTATLMKYYGKYLYIFVVKEIKNYCCIYGLF